MNRTFSIFICIAVGFFSLILPKAHVFGQSEDAGSANQEKQSISENLLEETEQEENLDSGIGLGFSDLEPEKAVTSDEKIFLKKGEQIVYQITYLRTGLSAEVLLLAEDGTEQVAVVSGGTGTGIFESNMDGWYTFGVRCSSENLIYKDTTLESLDMSGTVVFKYRSKG